jgi:hypothetical protein
MPIRHRIAPVVGIGALLLATACVPPGPQPPITGATDVRYELRGFVIDLPPGMPTCDLVIRFDIHLVDDSDALISSSAYTLGACALPEFLIDAFVLCQTPNAHPGTGDCGDVDVPAGPVPGNTLLSFSTIPDYGHLLYGALVVFNGRSSSTAKATHQLRCSQAGQCYFQVGSPN